MELSLENATARPLTAIRAQICVLLKSASGFNTQTNDNKVLRKPIAGVSDGDRMILTSWQNCGRVWRTLRFPAFIPIPSCLTAHRAKWSACEGASGSTKARTWAMSPRSHDQLSPLRCDRWCERKHCGWKLSASCWSLSAWLLFASPHIVYSAREKFIHTDSIDVTAKRQRTLAIPRPLALLTIAGASRLSLSAPGAAMNT
jgi:hypothetical protein